MNAANLIFSYCRQKTTGIIITIIIIVIVVVGDIKGETESSIVAAQDQAISAN
jgi:hypothetical protein